MARYLRLCLMLGMLALLAGPPVAAQSLVVVELFTSQGCSSCPPADALIGELSARPDVLVLSEHVDYWDYLGWQDPFAFPELSARQRAYARAFGLKYVYTPQIVVQGSVHMGGANASAVIDAIARAPRPPLPITLRWDKPERLFVALDRQPTMTETDIWLFVFDRLRRTRVARGENGGRELVNHHVVRDLRRLARWFGEPLAVTVDVPAVNWTTAGCAVLAQASGSATILGAARCGSPTR